MAARKKLRHFRSYYFDRRRYIFCEFAAPFFNTSNNQLIPQSAAEIYFLGFNVH